MNYNSIIAKLPYTRPFLFVDELNEVNENGLTGKYTFSEDLDFYKGHFKGNPITPGVILTECCAQIGVVCLGVYILKQQEEELDAADIKIGLSSSEMEFLAAVYPNETVTVTSKKIYFRFHKLKCEVKMYNAQGELVCKGVIAGMLKVKVDG